MLTTTQPVDEMPLDAIAFCDLLARILYRCLKDQEARVILFPRVSEHPLTLLPREESQSMHEISLVPGSSNNFLQTTGSAVEQVTL